MCIRDSPCPVSDGGHWTTLEKSFANSDSAVRYHNRIGLDSVIKKSPNEVQIRGLGAEIQNWPNRRAGTKLARKGGPVRGARLPWPQLGSVNQVI